jgi:hypothetical protein
MAFAGYLLYSHSISDNDPTPNPQARCSTPSFYSILPTSTPSLTLRPLHLTHTQAIIDDLNELLQTFFSTHTKHEDTQPSIKYSDTIRPRLNLRYSSPTLTLSPPPLFIPEAFLSALDVTWRVSLPRAGHQQISNAIYYPQPYQFPFPRKVSLATFVNNEKRSAIPHERRPPQKTTKITKKRIGGKPVA